MAIAKLINIEDAKVKTLTVQIMAITVSGKQMTLSTFRQLPERSIWSVAETPESAFAFRGVPWGRVRYRVGNARTGGGWFGRMTRCCIETSIPIGAQWMRGPRCG